VERLDAWFLASRPVVVTLARGFLVGEFSVDYAGRLFVVFCCLCVVIEPLTCPGRRRTAALCFWFLASAADDLDVFDRTNYAHTVSSDTQSLGASVLEVI